MVSLTDGEWLTVFFAFTSLVVFVCMVALIVWAVLYNIVEEDAEARAARRKSSVTRFLRDNDKRCLIKKPLIREEEEKAPSVTHCVININSLSDDGEDVTESESEVSDSESENSTESAPNTCRALVPVGPARRILASTSPEAPSDHEPRRLNAERFGVHLKPWPRTRSVHPSNRANEEGNQYRIEDVKPSAENQCKSAKRSAPQPPPRAQGLVDIPLNNNSNPRPRPPLIAQPFRWCPQRKAYVQDGAPPVVNVTRSPPRMVYLKSKHPDHYTTNPQSAAPIDPFRPN